jgi:hypothetical protein
MTTPFGLIRSRPTDDTETDDGDDDDARDRRHVVLPPDIAKMLPKNRLLSEVRAETRDARRWLDGWMRGWTMGFGPPD